MTPAQPAPRDQPERGVGWSQLDGRARWDELILPPVSRDLLRSIARDLGFRVRETPEIGVDGRVGVKLMFAGEPGTGKRLAARMLATDLGLPILSVDLTGVISRKRAESEERLDHLFETAERLRAIIYFADAGTWFAERAAGASTDAPEGIDPDLASLLERIDGYPGVVIFAATLGIAWAPVIERLDHVVEFPFPDEVARRRIWPLLLPASSELSERELAFLADSFPLTGGAIKRCVVAAVSAAASESSPARIRHFVAAIEREYGDRLHSARVRQALGRFYAGTWDAPAGAPAKAGPGASPSPARRPLPSAVAAQPRSRRRILRGLVFGAILAAALIGFLVAHSPRPSIARTPDLTAHLSNGPLRIAVPSPWRSESAPAGPVLGLHDEIAAGLPAPGAGVLVVGLEPETTVTLPPALLAALPRPPAAQLVTLGATHFYRYLDVAPSGVSGTESIYLVPTTAGTLIAQCFARAAPATFAETCEKVIATIRLSAGHVLPIGPSAKYATALDAALTKLDGAVTGATSRLSAAKTAADQAAAALALSAAYRAGAIAVGALDADSGAAASANRAVAVALSATGAAYAGLAHAATVHSPGSYDIARASVTHASAQLRAAIATLKTFGYAVR